MELIGPWLLAVILTLVIVLLLVSIFAPKMKRYKLQSPIKRIEPKPKHITKKTKKKKGKYLQIKIG